MEKLKQILATSVYAYEILSHPGPLATTHAGAEYFGINIGQTAPTLIIKADNGFLRLIISGDRGKVNMAELARWLGYSRVKLTARNEVEKITGFEPGWVPLFGIPLPVILDERLLRYDFVYGGAGTPNATLRVDPRAITKFNDVMAMIKDDEHCLFDN